MLGRIAQSVGHLTRKSGVLGLIPSLATYFISPSAFSRRAIVSYSRKYVHEVLVNRLGGLSLPRKSVVRLTDHPDMTLDVYRGCKTTIQQQQPGPDLHIHSNFGRLNSHLMTEYILQCWSTVILLYCRCGYQCYPPDEWYGDLGHEAGLWLEWHYANT